MLLLVPFLALALMDCQIFGSAPSKLWHLEIDGQKTRLLLSDEGVIYVCDPFEISALDKDGNALWDFKIDDYMISPPVIDQQGNILLATDEKCLFILDPDGNITEQLQTEYPLHKMALSPDGEIYGITEGIGPPPEETHVIRFGSDMSEIWNYCLSGYLYDIAIGPDNTIYVATRDSLYAFGSDGELKWAQSGGVRKETSLAIGKDAIYFVSGVELRAVSHEGSNEWTYSTERVPVSSPIIGPDGSIYFVSWNRSLYAINLDGTLKWIYDIDYLSNCNLAMDSEDIIYLGDEAGVFHAVDADGEKRWTYETKKKNNTRGKDKNITAASVIGDDGTVYFLCNYWEVTKTKDMQTEYEEIKTYLYALEGTSSGLADSPWPRDNRNTSCAANN